MILIAMPLPSHGWTPPHMMDRKTFVQQSGKNIAMSGLVIAAGTGGAVEEANAAPTTLSTTTPPPSPSPSPPTAGGFPNHYIYEPSPNSLTGQVHIITGATTGLGLESAKRLAAAGATVILTARTTAKGELARSKVRDYLQEKHMDVNSAQVYFLTLDLEHFESVRSFPSRYERLMTTTNNDNNTTTTTRKITVLMNNAGKVYNQRVLTDDGFESIFQSNHLGPFLLTALLFPYLDRRGSRIINVSSSAHNFATVGGTSTEKGLNLDNVDGSLYQDWAEGWLAYSPTKLENILFTEELQRRADAAGLSWLTTVSLHPGVVGTDIWRSQYVGQKNQYANTNNDKSFSVKGLVSSLFYDYYAMTIGEGANTQVLLASIKDDQIEKGQYYNEKGVLQKVAKYAEDPLAAKGLWETSEKLADVRFSVR
jgi:NAD(P)-dependent dehydrogenase (short-subunit alcohol dehydrogenase family)